jgi:hypothetical protein
MTVWRDIPSLPGYQVSDAAEVRRLPYRGALGRTAGGIILAQATNPRGYRTITAFVPSVGRYQPCLVHRVVCEAFHGPAPFKGAKALHWRNDLADNSPSNVRWGSQAENMADKLVDGTQTRGERHGTARLTEAAVRAIRASASTNTDLGARFGVNPETIRQVRLGNTWRHVE